MPIDYGPLAEDYARHRRVHPGVVRNLVEGARLGPCSRVLEVGCGTGNYALALAGVCGCRPVGIDPSRAMLDQARARPGSASFGPGCAENLDFGDASFDLVFSVDVIHHLTDPARYFSEAFRVLVPGGRVCTVTDSEWVIRNRCPLAVYFPETVAPELERYPPIPTLRGLMQDAGFTGLAEELEEFPYLLYDAGPLRARVYSALQLITDRAWQRGLDRLERDLAQGPVRCVARYTLLWGHKNEGGRGQ